MSELPNGWAITDIQSIATNVVVGFVGTSKTHYRDSGVPFLTGKNIKSGKIDLRKIDYITNEFHQKEKKSNLSPGDVVVVRIGRSGEAAVIPESLQDANCGGLVVIKKPLAILPELLSNYLNSPSAIISSQLEARGATRQTLNTKNIAEKKIPVPPLAEQTRIAAKLDELLAQVDTLKARIDGIPALLKRFRQSILAAAVSGRLTEEWREHSLIKHAPHNFEFGALITEMRNGLSAKPNEEGKGLPILRISSIRARSVDQADIRFLECDAHEEERYSLRAGDLLFTRYNGSLELVGVCGLIRKLSHAVLVYPDKLIRVRCNTDLILPDYLEIFFSETSTRQRVMDLVKSTSGQKGISGQDLKKMLVTYPSVPEQTEIVRRVEQLFVFADQLEARVKAAQARIDRLIQSILAKAFRGELVPQDPNDEPASVLLERIKAQRAAEPKAKRGRGAAKLS